MKPENLIAGKIRKNRARIRENPSWFFFVFRDPCTRNAQANQWKYIDENSDKKNCNVLSATFTIPVREKF